MNANEHFIYIPIDHIVLEGTLGIPKSAKGIILFAHGSGSSRLSPRNNYVARVLREKGIGTLLFDLLTEEEDVDYETRFDISLLFERLVAATEWLEKQPEAKGLSLGYFGASTGAAAAIQASVVLKDKIKAIVSRGGRVDLTNGYLNRVKAPTLLIVGKLDEAVVEINKDAYEKINVEKDLKIIPNATHLFEEPGALEEAAEFAAEWFKKYL